MASLICSAPCKHASLVSKAPTYHPIIALPNSIAALSCSICQFIHFQISGLMANRTRSPQSFVASSSVASSSDSSSYIPWDVFINHRGPDVKKTFASYLYRRLTSNGLRAFLDKEELEEGRNITSQIEQAIHSSSVHIAVFSPRYAESSWCLDELVLMVESGKTIIPVFYKVQPSVLRHTVKGEYAQALGVLQQKTTRDFETGEEKPRYSADIIQKWRGALSSVANISGFVIGDEDDEGELLDEVVERVQKNVPKPLLDVAKHPTGLNLKLEEFQKTILYKQETEPVEAKVVGIVGVGGVGKTTLAKEFFNLRRSDYSKSSFLFDVRETTLRKSVNYLQSYLLEDLTDGKIKIKIKSRDEGVGILRKYLSSCHALIVLDDIDHESQLEALLPIRDILSFDSLILATSRDKHVLLSSGVLETSIYNLKGLSRSHSEELFCSYALNQPSPLPEFADLSDRFVRACDGLPLSLKVFGALVCGQNESYWEAILDELDKILPTTEIQERLKISYDSLSSDDQQIFLDISSFFVGEKRDIAIRIWGLRGIQNLQDKCMLEVGAENSIRMHDHIRDLGRNVSQELVPRRLWQQTNRDINDLLEQSSLAMTEVRAITMLGCYYRLWAPMNPEMLMPWYKRWTDEVFGNCLRHLFNDFRFCDISNLQFIAVEDGYLERILKKARSTNLRWLRWYKCPYSCLPSWIPMKNLRVLELAGDTLKTLWQGESRAPLQLRELHIWAASSFSKFPKSIGQLQYLEKISISVMFSALKSLPEEFCELRSLKYMDFSYCSEMVSLPDNFGRLINLEHIKLNGAHSLQMLPESFGNLIQLKSLYLRDCSMLTFSSATLGNITTLEYIDISGCRNVTELPPQVDHQRSLKELRLSGANLEELPIWIGNLCNLEALSIGNNSLEVLPPFLLSCLKSLKELLLRGAPRLKYLADHHLPLTQLEKFHISFCGIEYLPQELRKMNNLLDLAVECCPLLEFPFKKMEEERERGREFNKLESFHDDDKCLISLKQIYLLATETSEIFFPECICPNLQYLIVRQCEKLTQIGGLCGLSKLQHLDIGGCVRLEELPNLGMLMSLETLNVSRCKKLRSIPGLGELKKLRMLHVHECDEILELSGSKHLMLLKELYAFDCPKLRWGEGELEQLAQRLKGGLKTVNAEGIVYH